MKHISSFTITLETWPAQLFIAHIRKEGRTTHFMQIENWHKQPRSSMRSAEINFLNQSVWGKIHLCKTVARSISSLCCSKVSSCNLIPLCGCTTRHADSTPLTSRHGLLIVARLRGTSSKDEEWVMGGCDILNMERGSKASLQNIKLFRWEWMPRRNNELSWQKQAFPKTFLNNRNDLVLHYQESFLTMHKVISDWWRALLSQLGLVLAAH